MLSLNDYQRRMTAEILGSKGTLLSGMTSAALIVHRETVFNTWVRALRLTFPSVYGCSPAAFQRLANEFMRGHPPRRPCLHDYGDEFPDFLASHPDFQQRDFRILPYLPDLARFDLALDRAAQQPLGPHGRSFTIAADLELRLNPAVARLDTGYPVDLIRDAVESGSDHPLAGLEMTPTPCRFAIWRGANGPTVKRLSHFAANFLTALLTGNLAPDAIGLFEGSIESAELLHAIRTEILTASFVEIVRIPNPGTHE